MRFVLTLMPIVVDDDESDEAGQTSPWMWHDLVIALIGVAAIASGVIFG